MRDLGCKERKHRAPRHIAFPHISRERMQEPMPILQQKRLIREVDLQELRYL